MQCQQVYTISRDHVLWHGLDQLLQARRTFFRRLQEEAETALPPGATVFLFGSVARHEAGPESDIDLDIIFEDETEATVREATVDFFTTLSERLSGNEAQVFAVDERDLARMQAEPDPVVDSWHQDAIDISGWPLRTRMEALRS